MPPRLEQRLQALLGAVSAREDALGLLALGSIGREAARADEHSDLDFFVIVRPGAKWHWIDDLGWLRAARPLVWSLRNTVDGHKALMDDGLFCEFAVFEPHELAGIPYAPGRWLWRRDELPASLEIPARTLPLPADAHWLVGEALSNLLVGLARHARGEKLSALRMVQVLALDRVLELRERHLAAAAAATAAAEPPAATRDPFAIERRIEQRQPGVQPWLATASGGYEATPAAARALLAEIERWAEVPAALAARIRELAGG